MQPQAAKLTAPRTLTTVNSILTLPETLQVGVVTPRSWNVAVRQSRTRGTG